MGPIIRSFLVAALALPALAEPARCQDGWWDSDSGIVPFESVLAHPLRYKDVPVVLTLQFAEKRSLVNPYFTIFTPNRFSNFAAWNDTTELWDRDEYRRPYSFFFVAKTNDFADRLADLPQRTRFSCKAIVRSVFKGEPWIEISEVNLHPEAVTGATVREGFQGVQAFDRGEYPEALKHFEAALATNPGEGPAASLWYRIASVHWKNQDLPKTKDALSRCLAVDPAYPPAVSLRDSVVAAEKRLLAIAVPKLPAKAPVEASVEPAAESLNNGGGAAPAAAPVAPPKAAPAPMAEPKAEPKPEPKAEPKPEPKPEPMAEPKPEPKAEPKPEVKKPAPPAEEPPPPPPAPPAPKRRPSPPK